MLVVPKDEVIITSSNVPDIESGITVYAVGSYNLGDIVQMGEDVFESLKADNTDTPIVGKTSLSWKFVRKTNKYLMWDSFMNTSTSFENEIIYELTTNDVDIVALFGLQAKTVRIELIKNGITLYDQTKDTYKRNVLNWTEWTTQRPKFKRKIYFKNIPFSYAATLRITISNPNSIAMCSHCTFGVSKDTGITLLDPLPTSSIRNIISKEKQADGSVLTSNSMTYDRVVLNVLIPSEMVSETQDFFKEYTVEPLLIIGDEREDGMDSLCTFGIYKDFDVPIGAEYSQYQIEIEGLI